MYLDQRQEKILEAIVNEYIKMVQPVSSEFLQKKYDFDICPATIRIEMQKLTDKGFLFQPHTSAGRVPTDKGYRFFVNKLFKKGLSDFEIKDLIKKEIENTIKFIQDLTKRLAFISRTLVLIYLAQEKICWKNGWEELLKEPEFDEKEYIVNFTEFLENFENKIEDIKINSEIKVWIGRENFIKKAIDFSVIISKYYLPDKGEAFFAFLGPKRMAYDRNIALMNSLRKLL